MKAHTALNISKMIQRQFIPGKQGLYPGRRWQGKAGVYEAVHAGCVVQMDPLSVVARSHDNVLYGRVLEYQPADLDAVYRVADDARGVRSDDHRR